jgi:hypothetical protein
MWPRSAAEITGLFAGLTLLPPGLVAAPAWRPDPGDAADVPDAHPLLAGVGRRD